MAIKKVKLPNNTEQEINDARNVAIVDSDGYIDTENHTEITGIVSSRGGIYAMPDSADGNEDFILATTDDLVGVLKADSSGYFDEDNNIRGFNAYNGAIYALPGCGDGNEDDTLVITDDLGSYLPLSGGTMSGDIILPAGNYIREGSYSGPMIGYDANYNLYVGDAQNQTNTYIAAAGNLYRNTGGSYAEILDKENSLQIITVTDNNSTTAGTWKASSSQITSLTDGLTIRYKVTVAGATTTTLQINNLAAKNVYEFGTTGIGTKYDVGSILLLYYSSTLNSGCWMLYNGYDSNTNTYVRQYVTTGNTNYPILTRYGTGSVSTYEANYARFATAVTLNPSTGYITAGGFKTASGTSTQYLRADGSVGSITISSSEPTSADGNDGDIWIKI